MRFNSRTSDMDNKGGISVGYVGVHAAYQAALAAAEIGRLDQFYCSLLDAPGKWGGLLSLALGSDRLANRRVPGLPPERVIENPWPFLRERARTALHRARPDEWLRACEAFDRWLATQLKGSHSRVFYGGETCSEHAFREARQRGMKCLLDCSGVHPAFLQRILLEAGQPAGRHFLSAPMVLRKLRTYDLADVLVTQSDIQTRSFLEAGIPPDKIIQNPRGVDACVFHTVGRPEHSAGSGPLKALFVGRVTVLKGIPWLWDALRRCLAEVQLTVVGSLPSGGRELLSQAPSNVTYRANVTKEVLRSIYQNHDVFVFPSLIDCFGNVAMEAMACGLPVILTDHCGTPVPDESWRVPVRDGKAIAERLLRYAADRELLGRDQGRAAKFAPAYSQAAFRGRLAARFLELLSSGGVAGTR